MESNNPSSQRQCGNITPLKPWQRVGNSSRPAPFKPPSPRSASNVVEASATAKPGEVAAGANSNVSANWNVLGYVSTMNYDSGYGSGTYNSYGGFGGSYGGGLYGNSMYRGYDGLYGGPGLYLGSMYNSRFGGPINGYGMAMRSPYGNSDPNDLDGPCPSPPGFWMSFVRVMHVVVNFLGRISVLIDENMQAFHMFMSALLQLFDRSGLLYGELAKFVLRLLGMRTKPGRHYQLGPEELIGPNAKGQHHIEDPNSTNGCWNSVWGDDLSKETR